MNLLSHADVQLRHPSVEIRPRTQPRFEFENTGRDDFLEGTSAVKIEFKAFCRIALFTIKLTSGLPFPKATLV